MLTAIQPHRIHSFTLPDGARFEYPLSSAIGENLFAGQFEPAEIAFVRRHLRPGDVVLDVGANAGLYTVIAARAVGNTGHVYAFEPDERAVKLLRRNVAVNGLKNVTVIEAAVSNETGERAFAAASDTAFSSLATIQRDDQQIESWRSVPTIRLDDAVVTHGIGVVKFLKIDVEGAEKLVLDGGTNLLLRAPDDFAILFEAFERNAEAFGYTVQDLLEILRSKGFHLGGFDPSLQLHSIDEVESSIGTNGYNFIARKKRLPATGFATGRTHTVNRNALQKNVCSAAGQTVVQIVVLFFLYRYLIGRLGIEQLGVWGVVLATTSVARIGELGLSGSVTKFVSTHRSQGNDRAAREGLQTAAISLAAILAVLLPTLYVALVPVLPHLLPATAVGDARAVLPYAFASMWLTAIAGVCLGGLDGCLRSDLRALLVILTTLTFMALALLTVPTYGLIGLAVSQVAQGSILTVLGWLAIRQVMRPMPALPVEWSAVRFREMIGYGMNIQVMAVVMLFFEPTTKLLFARYGGLASAGYFELAQQLVMRARALVVESNRVVVPVVAAMERSGAETRRFYFLNVRYLMFLLTPLFAGLAAFVPAISELCVGRYEPQFVIMALALVVAWYINSLSAPAYFAYLGEGKLRWVTTSHVALGVGNAALGLVLGPAFGWPGVVTAFVMSLTIGSLVPVWTYHREHHLRLPQILTRSDLMLAVFCAIIATAAVAGYSTLVALEGVRWIRLATAITAAAALAAATYAHPLAPELILMVRRGRVRHQNSTL